jgi:hypothetical protein
MSKGNQKARQIQTEKETQEEEQRGEKEGRLYSTQSRSSPTICTTTFKKRTTRSKRRNGRGANVEANMDPRIKTERRDRRDWREKKKEREIMRKEQTCNQRTDHLWRVLVQADVNEAARDLENSH